MLKRISSFILSYLPRNRSRIMETKPITFIVTTDVAFGDDGDWKRKVRAVRAIIKDTINSDRDFRIVKIENKEG